MKVRALLEALSPLLGADFDALRLRFDADGSGDDSDFIAWCHREELITAAQCRDAVASLEVTLTPTGDKARPDAPRHRLLGVLGRGAMGEVHLARDEALHRAVAVKMMDPRLVHEPALAQRFHDEIQITAQLDHPAIMPVYAVERREDGTLSYAMKLIRGRTLKEVMGAARATHEAGQKPDTDAALPARLDLFLQVCGAVDFAHARGVLHRDLKPDNIMVGPFRDVIVMDWGIARVLGEGETACTPGVEGAGRVKSTRFGAIIGTLSYMSPEQAFGRNEDVDARSDQFALGLILFEIVTLRRARVASNADQMLQLARDGRVGAIEHISPNEAVPRELAAIVRKATAKLPGERYERVEALADDVRRYLRGDAVLARPDTRMQTFSRWVARRRELSAAILLGLLLLVFVVVAVGVSGGVAAREAARLAAAEREERLTGVLAVASSHARGLDTALQHYEGLLNGLAFAAEAVLAAEPLPAKVYLNADYATPGLGPPDLGPSTIFEQMSLDHIDVGFAEGVEAQPLQRRLHQLAALQPAFLRVLLQSSADNAITLSAAEQRRLIGEDGVPVTWAYVALEEGVIGGLPGTPTPYPDGYDPRQRPWYLNAHGKRAPHWGSVYLDESGMGLLLGCGTGLFSPEGAFVGVAALDVTVGCLVETLLQPAGMPVEAYLVDSDGRVVVRSGLKEQATSGQEYQPEPFAWPGVVQAVSGGRRNGHLEINEDLVVWSTLDTMPWTYVLVGEGPALLGR